MDNGRTLCMQSPRIMGSQRADHARKSRSYVVSRAFALSANTVFGAGSSNEPQLLTRGWNARAGAPTATKWVHTTVHRNGASYSKLFRLP